MTFALIKNNTVIQYPYSLTTFRDTNPNICLPTDPTEYQLNEQGIYYINTTDKPNYDSINNNCIEVDPTLKEGKWYQTWSITQASESEVEYRKANYISENINYAKQLLIDTDWTQMPDVSLVNKQEFTEYRATLRSYVLNPSIDAFIWPTKPEEVWE